MPVSASFRQFVLEQLEGFGPVAARPMFGGYGLYSDGTLFAVLDNDAMFLRADEAERPEFQAAGSLPFAPIAGAKPMMAYWGTPVDVLEDRGELVRWCERALLAALRAKAAKTKSAKTARTKSKESRPPRRKPRG